MCIKYVIFDTPVKPSLYHNQDNEHIHHPYISSHPFIILLTLYLHPLTASELLLVAVG